MKRLTIVKFCNEIQLAHLYEHLYLSTLTKLCEQHKLLNYLDYRAYGKTYEGGFIYIDIALISSKAQKLAKSIPKLKLKIDDEAIAGAVAQLVAEKGVLFGANIPLLYKGLEKLQAQDWSYIEKMGQFNAALVRRSHRTFWASDKKAAVKILKCELSLDDNFFGQNKELSPLFYVVATALHSAIADEFDETCHFFADERLSLYSRKAREVANYKAWQNVPINIEETLQVCVQKIEHVLQQGFTKKLEVFLQSDIYREEFIEPDELKVYEACEFLIGDVGWQNIATADTIKNIIEHTTVSISLGRKTQTQQVGC